MRKTIARSPLLHGGFWLVVYRERGLWWVGEELPSGETRRSRGYPDRCVACDVWATRVHQLSVGRRLAGQEVWA